MRTEQPWVLPYGTPVPDGMADAGTAPPAGRVQTLVAEGRPVLVTLDGGAEPGALAAASVYAWLGVRAFRTPEEAIPALRQVLDMVASIQGTRPPTLTRRGLA